MVFCWKGKIDDFVTGQRDEILFPAVGGAGKVEKLLRLLAGMKVCHQFFIEGRKTDEKFE
jgi:hypothetical protein